MPTAPVNGIDLFYEDTGLPPGDEAAPVIVFLHGAAGNHLSWWQQVPTFRPHYRCISIDHRGFGRSADPAKEGGTRFIDDLDALVEHLGLSAVYLVAQSMGGRAALGYACRKSERVKAVVMADTWGFFDWPEQRERARELAGAVTTPLLHRALAASFQEREPARTFLYRQIEGLNPPREGTPLPPADGPTLEDVRALQVPVLCLVGAEDVVTHPPLIKALADELPNSQYVEVPGAGHSVYFEQPQRFNEIVGEFLARHGGNPIS
ncbi:MAG: alpha/beta hydrolase [Dehalococcoidia bacterium]|nr:alpha/beta hydrolase [Dehalococcoidia bacterium]